MKKLKWLSMALALAMCTSFAMPALAAEEKSDAEITAQPLSAAKQKLSPGKLFDLVEESGGALFEAMGDVYNDLSSDEIAEILASAGEDYLDIMEEVLDNLLLIAEIDEDEEIPYSYKHTETPHWTHEDDGSAIYVHNSNEGVVVHYIYGGKLQEEITGKGSAIMHTDDKAASLINTPDLKIREAQYYVKAQYIRAQNRLLINFGSADGLYDLGGVDLVYRGENSIFMQAFYPVKRIRDLDIAEPYRATRVLLQAERVRMSQSFISKADISSIRLSGGYPSWEAFAFEDSNTFDFTLKGYKLYDPSGKLLLDSATY